MNIINLCEKYYNHSIITLAGEVIDLLKYKEKKKSDNDFILLFDLMDANTLLSSNTINIDDMHAARKATGFKKVPDGSPTWLYVIIHIIDIKDPTKRKAQFIRYLYLMNEPKTPEAKKDKQDEIDTEKTEFIRAAKNGWIRANQFNDWRDNYPLLFNEYNLKDWKRDAKEYLETKNETELAKKLYESIVPKDFDIQGTEIGTTLYAKNDSIIRIYQMRSITKQQPDTWLNNQAKTIGSDIFIKRLIDNRCLLFSPPETFKFVPREYSDEELNAVIDHFIKTEPEEFVERKTLWKYKIESIYEYID